MVRTTLIAKIALSQSSLMARWDKVSPAVKNIKFTYNGKWAQMLRYFYGRMAGVEDDTTLGLLFHDQCFEPAPEVKEALRRLNLKEPWLFDERKIRLYHAHSLKSHGEQLPREKWTKWEDETWYLKPYLDEIEEEKRRGRTLLDCCPVFD
ncbi:Cytochrome b-c1 complex subunit 7 [Dirofilaria immitis]|nr:Cytochrome b-c1 complex subunit 7 [Dirofilaria immitis]